MLLQPLQPFNFQRTLKFILGPPALMNGRTFPPLLDHFHKGEYRRAIRVEGKPTLYGVSEMPNGSVPSLKVRILRGPATKTVSSHLRHLVARQFCAHLDLAPFYRMAESDRVLQKLTRHFRGLRIPQTPSTYESVICAILEQQVNLTFAYQVKKALVDTCGQTVEFDGKQYSMFPGPAVLAIVTPEQLRKLQISGPKARYIIEFSRAVADGRLDLEELHTMDSARARLMEYKGIGPWTADYVCLRALGKPDHLPASDVGLQKAIQLFYRLRKLPSPVRVEKLARKWAGWRSYATFYLWLTYWESVVWKQDLLAEIYSANRMRRR